MPVASRAPVTPVTHDRRDPAALAEANPEATLDAKGFGLVDRRPTPGIAVLKSLSIFTGNSNRALADEICKFVEIPLGRADVTHFSDGEIYVEVGENVRGVNCFVVQPT